MRRINLMFLVISVIIFLLLLLVSGCKFDSAEHQWGKSFATKPILKINCLAPVEFSDGVGITTIINKKNLAHKSGANIVYYDNSYSELISCISASIKECKFDVEKNSVVIKVTSNQRLWL